jgi:hypothetical protein
MVLRLTSEQAEADVNAAEVEAEVVPVAPVDRGAFETPAAESPKTKVACVHLRSGRGSITAHMDSVVKGDLAPPRLVEPSLRRHRPVGSGLTIPPR